MPPANLIAVFRKFPRQLFRANYGPEISLRVWAPQRYSYDIFAPNVRVEPKALNRATYMAPNGASMRPNSAYQQTLVSSRMTGDDVIVYSVAKGTHLPQDLLLVHERPGHYSVQPAKDMGIDDLNAKITRFMLTSATVLTRAQWLEAYPEATEE